MSADRELEAVAQMVRTMVPVWVAANPRLDKPICGGSWPDGWRYDATGPRVRVTGPGVEHQWSRQHVLDAVVTVSADPQIAGHLAEWRARPPADDAYELRRIVEDAYSVRAATLLLNRAGQLSLFAEAV